MQDLTQIIRGQGSDTLRDLVSRFDQGQHDQVPDSTVHQSYEQVAAQLPHDEYMAAAEAAFARLSPDQRAQLAQQLQTGAEQHGVSMPAGLNAPADPTGLASAAAQVHAQQPNLLQQIFAPGGAFSSPIAKAALLGITAMAAQRLMGRR